MTPLSFRKRFEGYGFAIKLFVILPAVLITAMILGVTSPQYQNYINSYNQQNDLTEKKITTMDCLQLQQIRLDSIAGKDVSEYKNHWGTIRDMYNALACGNHWGVWED